MVRFNTNPPPTTGRKVEPWMHQEAIDRIHAIAESIIVNGAARDPFNAYDMAITLVLYRREGERMARSRLDAHFALKHAGVQP